MINQINRIESIRIVPAAKEQNQSELNQNLNEENQKQNQNETK